MPTRPTLNCADCGKPMWTGPGALPQGQARCRPCRKAKPAKGAGRECPECGGAKSPQAEVCKPCRAKRQVIRAEGDGRLVRKQREHAAPGIRPCERNRLLAKWKRQGKPCIYCGERADTIDHVVPLVRGGTNYEGNLAPCCKPCNSRKGGLTVAEWRTGKRLPRMTNAVMWARKARPSPIKAITGEQVALFRTCIACNKAHGRESDYCSERCQARSRYRLKVGLPLTLAPYRAGSRNA